MPTELFIDGMTCGNCARHVSEAIQSVPEVRSASVSLENKNALVQWKSSGNVPAVLEAVKRAGYRAKEAGDGCHAPMRKDWQPGLWLGIVVTAFLMAGEWVFQIGAARWFPWASLALAGAVQIFSGARFYRGAWRQLKNGGANMDTLVALGSTTAFGYSAWALLSGAGGHLYFMEAAAIITLISLGHWIEARVSEKAGGALKLLLNLAPQTARLVPRSSRLPGHSLGAKAGGDEALTTPSYPNETEIAVSELQVGDQILLRPGDHVPVDGVVVAGESAVDESSLTGESASAGKKTGSELFAGTVNLDGRLVMRVTATGEETALARVIAAVQRAQTSRADIQRLGDSVSSVFVPVVVVIALAAGLWWGLAPESANSVHRALAPFLWPGHAPGGIAAGFIIAAAVLIIACPCAMGLATPAAIMAGANAAARRGILIRDGVALEKAGRISALVFDKTGTLTLGKLEVADVCEIQTSRFNARSLAAALARDSSHPVSRAIAQISAEPIELNHWQEIRGAGIEADARQRVPAGLQGEISPKDSRIEPLNRWPAGDLPKHEDRPAASPSPGGEGRGEGERLTDYSHRPPVHGEMRANREGEKVRLGSLRWLRENGIDPSPGENFASEWSDKGASIIGLEVDKNLLALFALRDTVKPHAANVVAELQRSGLKIFLVTGDNSRTAAGIARQVGIAPENVFAEMRPGQKAGFVKKLQAAGEHVAFVGDGINDAPALTQADLGIAVRRSSDIAREAADIVLLKSDVSGVPEALDLAQATLKTIKQNLFWAFFYNSLGLPLAVLGFVSPIFCAAAMGASDLIVIGNALRLLRRRRP